MFRQEDLDGRSCEKPKERPLLVSWGRRRECQHVVENETSASVMSFGFGASNGAMMPMIWFLSGYRLTARDHEAKLADKLVTWINNPLKCHLSLLCFNKMVPQHTHPIESNISCKCKISSFGRKTCVRHSRQTPTHWTTTPGRKSGYGVQCSSLKHYRTQNIHRSVMNGYEQGLRYQKQQGFQTPSFGYHRLG